MAIDSTQLITQLKAFARANPLPLDSSEVHASKADALAYAAQANAYAGQTIKVLENGVYVPYILNGTAGAYELTKVGVDASAVKNYVQIVETLPVSGQEQGVIYIDGELTGHIWNGTSWDVIFEQIVLTDEEGNEISVSEAIEGLDTRVDSIEETLKVLTDVGETNGSIANQIFVATEEINGRIDTLEGTVNGKANAADVYTKGETDSAIATAIEGMNHLTRTIVDELPVEGIDTNTIYMMSKEGADGEQRYDEYMYIEGNWEKIGDSAVDLSDYLTADQIAAKYLTSENAAATYQTAEQVEGIVTSKGYVTADDVAQNYVTADDVASSVATAKQEAIDAAASDAATKADQAKADAIAAAASDATTKADQAKADAVAEANEYTDGKVSGLNTAIGNLETVVNSKVNADQVNDLISDKVGEIPAGTSVKEYVDNAIGSGGTDAAEAIAIAKQEAIDAAKEYTDSQITEAKGYTDTKVGNLNGAADVVTYVNNAVNNIALNIIEF